MAGQHGVWLVQLGYSHIRLVAVCARVRFHLNLFEEKSMKMKLNALSLAVAAGFIGSAAQAADVAMFPYVVNSPSVTTIVSIVDLGNAATQRYNNAGVIGAGAGFNRLHYRLNYKAGALAGMDATSRAAACQEVNYYLPSSPSDIQTFDLGGRHSTAAARGVMFNDASINNNYIAGTTATINYMLGANAGSVQRGVLYIHNADTVAAQTLYGEAMVLDFSTGAAWGYQALLSDEGAANTAAAFNFVPQATNAADSAPDILTFMPAAEVTTRLFVTPVTTAGTVLGADGASIAGWDNFTTLVSMATGAGVAFDRDENLVSGSAAVNIKCVGAIDHTELMTAGAAAVLANGGHGLLTLAAGTLAAPAVASVGAVATKLEFSRTNGGTLNGVAVPGTYNNGFIMR
ncbi:MAG: hypothetical protein K2W33_10015 [Burkholderiales bacterium]|nr:hypothetical protein [Burkholderiales bacterium]